MLEPEAILPTGVSFTWGGAAVMCTGVVGGSMVEKGMVRREREREAMRHVLLYYFAHKL
jgi:hypothetical protein